MGSPSPPRSSPTQRIAAVAPLVIALTGILGLSLACGGSYSPSLNESEGGWVEQDQEYGGRGDREELQAVEPVAASSQAESRRPSPAFQPRHQGAPPPRAYDGADKRASAPGVQASGAGSKSGASYAELDSKSSGESSGGKNTDVKGAKEVSQPMVVYFGYLKLRVRRQIEAFDAITKLAQTAGGYVQTLSGTTIVVRVPATDFDAAMGRFAAIGETLDRRIKSVDVSKQYTDMEARLQVAVQARSRLLHLLEKVKNTDERLQILQEIKRMTELIETAEGTLAALRNLANFFTITIDIVPIVADGGHIVHRSPFGWVRGLTPHLVTLFEGKKATKMVMPRGFVLFEEDEVFRAQAADTSLLRVGRVDNEPKGDAAFWSLAVQHELEGRDEELVLTQVVGALQVRVWRNKDVHPRYYLVGTAVAGDFVYALEVFLPSELAWNQHKESLWQALATLEVSP
ncbi:MAG: DUF4349 domain-containing protein [Myxococcales bacterium]|nr:DUF4349 domain-containing protein [Myxococcales bacterium]